MHFGSSSLVNKKVGPSLSDATDISNLPPHVLARWSSLSFLQVHLPASVTQQLREDNWKGCPLCSAHYYSAKGAVCWLFTAVPRARRGLPSYNTADGRHVRGHTAKYIVHT